MNGAYIHLVLNHFPPILEIAALILLVCGAIWRSDAVRRAAFVILIFAGLTGVVTYMTGDKAAGIVKEMEGVNRAAIGPHDEAAGATLVTVGLSFVFALFALVRYHGDSRPIPRWVTTVAFLLVILATISATYTALLGGRIHHPETHMRRAR